MTGHHNSEGEINNKGETMKTISLFIFALLITLMTISISQACEIDDIIEMVNEGKSSSDISKECTGKVSDATACTVRKIVRLANDGNTKQQISAQCANSSLRENPLPQTGQIPPTQPINVPPQPSNVCQTPSFWCALPQAAYPGTPCYCGWPPINGVIVPR